eukprot:5753959-Prymnesium_polylepis.1
MSWSWTDELCEEALEHDPGCPYETASGMTPAVFGNFMMEIGHGSYATVDLSGYQMQMTNWATVFLPSAA